MPTIRLGLIGDNIRTSRSPDLHRIAGAMTGLDVRYDLFIPPAMGMSFPEVFEACRADGLVGVNVTLPYKERVVPLVRVDDPAIARIGSVNTVLFTKVGPLGFNTDFSGFVAAYRNAFGAARPGRVALIGAGGAGRAIAFGLCALGAEEIALIDTDPARAGALQAALTPPGDTRVRLAGAEALARADGVVNATPLGMDGYPGSPVAEGAFPAGGWAFDAVYTPVTTPFRDQALAAGARFLSGWELFFFQGIAAFERFTGRRPTDLMALREALGDPSLRLAS
ncbi:shikimate dehydrogenase family protein [Albidovulum sediminicola]|uniref:Shikimate dehydrogenase n=1 Tax=Albidovulum sediminicola TaxID=2984331 RepID=A0ABT2Z149_9RHOB|nr:NAD(P)-binding domain-containing protein [Defluviimonas sp. WL0075]MCV2864868.1 shikimate dehydrogenase [Defluviimonas sp. WL0075]